MQEISPLRFQSIAALIALAFLVKFVAYAWLTTPLWDIPDESGHYAYAEDISRLEWPVLGEARIGEDVMHSWKGVNGRKGSNWIVQHPPLFHAVDAPVIAIARVAGLDLDQRVRSARMPSALFGALTVFGLALFLSRATGNQTLGLAGALLFAATPMFTHLSTGVTHDTLVACTATWAAYWCTRWLESGYYRHLLYAGLLVALCILTKITALAMAVPLFFALAWRLWRIEPDSHRLRHWLLRAGGLWLVMFIPVLLWIARNQAIFGQPLPDSSILSDTPIVAIGFFDLMRDFPFWEHTLLNFIALVGWNGSEGGKLVWIQANGMVARYFLAVFASAGLISLFVPAMKRMPPAARMAVAGAGLLAVILVYSQATRNQLALWTCMILFVTAVATILVRSRAFIRGDSDGWLLATAAICTLAFAFIYYHHLLGSFTGTMRATHGRYFYPVLPFLFLLLAHPMRGKLASRLLLCASLGAMLVADAFYLHQVFPMYGLLPA